MKIDMEMLKSGKDSQGDEFTDEALVEAVNEFTPGLPVFIGLDVVGEIIAMKLLDGTITATVSLDQRGEKAIKEGMELAASGYIDDADQQRRNGPMKITKMRFSGGILTSQKVK